MVLRARRWTRSGMAAIFDALMFLTAVSVVSVSAVLLASERDDASDEGIQRLAEGAHVTFLRATVLLPGDGADRKGSPPIPVGSLLPTLIAYDEGGDADLPSWLEMEARQLLDGLLSPRFHYSWSVSCGAGTVALSPWPAPDDGRPMYVSTLPMDAQSATVSRLAVWEA